MAELLKNLFFKPDFVEKLADVVNKGYQEFNAEGFKSAVLNGTFNKLELKQKMRHISVNLHGFLPQDYESAIKILLKASPGFKGFNAMVFSDYVECYGLEYAVYYRLKNMKLSKKVYHITETNFKPGMYSFTKERKFTNLTTRKIYEGDHFISIIVNGEEFEKTKFSISEINK